MNFDAGTNGALALRRLMEQLGMFESNQTNSAQQNQARTNDNNQSSISIEQLFHLDATSATYIKEGKYEEAYGLVKKQYKIGDQLNFLPVLVKYYVSLMQTGRPDKAAKIRDEIISLMKKLLDTSAADTEHFAAELMKKKKNFDAILFFQIAAVYCKNESNPGDSVNILHRCSQSIKTAVTDLIENQHTSKQLVRDHMIPVLRKINDQIAGLKGIDKKSLSFIRTVCFHHIEQCQFLAGDLSGREASLKESISIMKDGHGKDAEKKQIYGGALNNLGHTYLLKDRPNEAAKYFSQAIVAKKRAEDYDSEAEKREDVQRSEMALQIARRQL